MIMSESVGRITRRSVLYEIERDIGATFAIVNGWEMADVYSSPEREHLTVRAHVGLGPMSRTPVRLEL